MNTKLAERMALGLMKRYDLPSNVSFHWTAATKTFGRAEHNRYTLTPIRLKLSKPLVRLNSIKQVKETLLHEIAHLLTTGEGHNNIWRRKCQSMGGIATHYYDDSARVKILGEVIKPIRKIR